MIRRAAALALLLLLGSLGFSVAATPIPWNPDHFMPVEDVRAGMTGVGRSVFKGTAIEEFQVEILGVLSTPNPGGEMILARLSGMNLEKSGIIAGMSGSPIFVDGKLIGALAFGWPFSTEPIAGITPIRNMVSLLSRPEGDSTPGRMNGASPGLWEALWDTPNPEVIDLLTGSPGSWDDDMSPLMVPVSISGLLDHTSDELKVFLNQSGFHAVQGGAGPETDETFPTRLEPGSAVGVDLVRGSARLSAIGTVTWVEDDQVLAFGHQMFNLGPSVYPMSAASIVTVLPSLNRSFKMGLTGGVLGSVTRDYQAGVAGELGPPPRMIPVSVDLSFGQESRRLGFEVIRAETLTPVLVGLLAFNSVESLGRSSGPTTLRVSTRVELGNGRKLNTSMVTAGFSPPMAFAGEVARVVGLVIANPFESVSVERVDITVEIEDQVEAAFLDEISISPREFHPGERIPIRASFRDYRGEESARTLIAEIPPGTRPGTYQILVCDGVQADINDQERAPGRYRPRDLEHMLEILETATPFDRLVTRMVSPDPNLVVSGRELPSLPKSMTLAVQGRNVSGRSEPTKGAVIFESEASMGKVVIGCRTVSVNVEAP